MLAFGIEFHQLTKLSYQSVRENVYQPDWNQQPAPFRHFQQGPLLLLEPHPTTPLISLSQTFSNLVNVETHSLLDLTTLSQIFKYSLSIREWREIPNSGLRYPLRVNPSCGNLHPEEIYVMLGSEMVGLYHYNLLEQCLEKRQSEDLRLLIAKATGYPELANQTAIAVVTGIGCRQYWKYRNRGYRYLLQDIGHASGALMLAAASLGFSVRCIANFPDQTIKELLGLNFLPEEPFAIISIGKNLQQWKYPSLKPEEIPPIHEFLGAHNNLGAEAIKFEDIVKMNAESLLDIADLKPPLQNKPITQDYSFPFIKMRFADVAWQRKSAQSFDTKRMLSQEEFNLLVETLKIPLAADFLGSVFGGAPQSWLEYYCFVHQVEGMVPGVYQLVPETSQWILLQEGNFSQECAQLHLEQTFLSSSAITLSMVGNFQASLDRFGERGYRLLNLEAGLRGQLLYLTTQALGLRSVAIGAFYDDELNQFLSLPIPQKQVIYSFAIGY
ncbi:MAG: SagB family peptide dehydrogenase [Deltaproteobacteria bacterium]|nr:SagB family peptide dehydrogenase [Deltaproteobacteria bacterium]